MEAPVVPGWQLAIRFGLEVGALVAVGKWVGSVTGAGIAGWSAALGVPALIALSWAICAVRGDPSRSGRAPVAVPGWLRLLIELAVFGVGAVALARLEQWSAFAVLIAALVVHHAGSWPRLRWLLASAEGTLLSFDDHDAGLEKTTPHHCAMEVGILLRNPLL